MDENSQIEEAFGARIEYRTFDLGDVRLVFDEAKLAQNCVRIESVVLAGERLKYSDRFGISLATLLKQSPSIFTLFDVGEVVARALERKKSPPRARIAIDRTVPGCPVALAVAPSEKRYFTTGDIRKLVEHFSSSPPTLTYLGDGMFSILQEVTDHHPPFRVAGNSFTPGLNLRLAIDGWGKPTAWLALVNAQTAQPIIAMADAFKHTPDIGEASDLFVSKLATFVADFEDMEGFRSLSTRFDAAYVSVASLSEIVAFQKAFHRTAPSSAQFDLVDALVQKSARRYGLSSLSGIPRKRASGIPGSATVADLIIRGGEIYAETPANWLPIGEWTGRILSDSDGFDLEGIIDGADLRQAQPIPDSQGSVPHPGSELPSPLPFVSSIVQDLGVAGVATLLRSKPTRSGIDQGEGDDGYQEDSPT